MCPLKKIIQHRNAYNITDVFLQTKMSKLLHHIPHPQGKMTIFINYTIESPMKVYCSLYQARNQNCCRACICVAVTIMGQYSHFRSQSTPTKSSTINICHNISLGEDDYFLAKFNLKIPFFQCKRLCWAVDPFWKILFN